jgi:hypothetical protein
MVVLKTSKPIKLSSLSNANEPAYEESAEDDDVENLTNEHPQYTTTMFPY